MKKITPIVFLTVFLFIGSGCTILKELPGEVVKMNLEIYSQYDEYVVKDPELGPEDKQDLLRNTAMLRKIFQMLEQGITSIDFLTLE